MSNHAARPRLPQPALASVPGPPQEMTPQQEALMTLAVARGVVQALEAVQVRTHRRVCVICLAAFKAWSARHEGDLGAAQAAAASGTPPGPGLEQMGVAAFLPARLRPGSGHAEAMPEVSGEDMLAGGTGFCADHAPAPAGVPQAPVTPGRKEFLIANGALTSAMIREARGHPGSSAV